jgi:hypothetical protein
MPAAQISSRTTLPLLPGEYDGLGFEALRHLKNWQQIAGPICAVAGSLFRLRPAIQSGNRLLILHSVAECSSAAASL